MAAAPAVARNNTTRPKGVTWVPSKWRSTFRHRKQRFWLGHYPDKADAIQASEDARLRLGIPQARAGSKRVNRQPGYWVARIMIDGKRHFLGRFDSAAEAAAAYMAVAWQASGMPQRRENDDGHCQRAWPERIKACLGNRTGRIVPRPKRLDL
ncbi:hypothetical protein [Rhizobium sp. RAF56]|uniref:hypothetical protein n=1 Tax=Rhizobium sp. RAF56 TaxID=3233062 RepID=UPI003F9633BB